MNKEWDKHAVEQVLNFVRRQEPSQNCFQCSYCMNLCKPNKENTYYKKCMINYEKEYAEWKKRIRVWKARLHTE